VTERVTGKNLADGEPTNKKSKLRPKIKANEQIGKKIDG
jgi:hypothetical protein